MATWHVQGAGDSTYDGLYYEAGTYGGEPYYEKPGATRYLYYYVTEPPEWYWVLGTNPGDLPAYNGEANTPLPGGTWSVWGGTPPAPTVSAKAAETPPTEKAAKQTRRLERQPSAPFPEDKRTAKLLRDLYRAGGAIAVTRGATADSGIRVSDGYVDIPDMQLDVDFGPGIVECRFVGTFESPDQSGLEFVIRLTMDGSDMLGDSRAMRQENTIGTTHQGYTVSYLDVFQLPQGTHTLRMQYRNWSGGTLRCDGYKRIMVVRLY